MEKGNKKVTAGLAEFRFDFSLYDGKDPDKLSFDDTNVVEYEFINQGNSCCRINDGLLLYPVSTGIDPTRWKGTINEKEHDTTAYRFRFEDAPVQVDPRLDRLLVITKVVARL